MRGSVRAGGRSRAAALAAATAVLLTVTACSDGGSSEADPSPSGEPADSSAEPSEDASSEPPEDLPEVDPEFGFTAGGVCRGEATLAGTQPFPDDPSQLSALLLFESMPFPDATTDEPYVPVSAGFDWSLAGTDLTDVNAVVCVAVVPESIEVRKKCTDPPYPDLQPDAWEQWTADYVVTVVDPTTAEVMAEGEPFASGDFIPGDVGCLTTAPSDKKDAAYGYTSDMPTIRYWGPEADEVVRLLY